MAEQVEIEIKMASKYWQDPPRINIFLDDELIEKDVYIDLKRDEQMSKVFKFNRELSEGEHSLTIELTNKTSHDTILDNEGKILKDKLLYIQAVSIDDIDLDQVLHKSSAFYPTEERLAELSWLEKKVTVGHTCLGHPGKWILTFSVPTYLWLLEHL